MSDNPLRYLPDCLTSCNTRRLLFDLLQYSQARIGLTKPIYKPTDKTI